MPMTTVYFYEFVHKKCPLCPLKGMFLGVLGRIQAICSCCAWVWVGLWRREAPSF